MSAFDYESQAGLFSAKGIKFKQKSLGYRRFEHAAEAIRFAVEELPSDMLRGASLEADDAVYMGWEIRELYDREDFPLERRAKPPK
jgi:hypothetical protein